MGLLLLCIGVNVFGRLFAASNQLPGWFDCYGTFLAAYIAGPVPAAIIGASCNVIFSFWLHASPAYALVSVFIGLSVGYLARKKYFETVFHAMTVAGGVAVGAVVISTILNLLVADGSTSNIWGDGVRDYLVEMGLPRTLSLCIGELYLEFPDKLMTSIVVWFLVKCLRKYRDRKQAKEAAAKGTAAITAFLLLLTPGLLLRPAPVHAEEEQKIAYIQTIYNGENGLVCGHANAVAETTDGILWIGTYAGLYRYNGSEFRHMDSFENIRNVNCLYADSEGRLWVGTNDNGCAIVIDEEVTNVLDTSNSLPSDSIRSIVQSASGEYYIGTAAGLVTVKLEMGISLRAEFPKTGYVTHLAADGEGHVAAVNNEGTLFLFWENKIIQTVTSRAKSSRISSCDFGEDGTLYVGTTDGLVSEYRINGDTLKKNRVTGCSGITKINQITPGQNGYLWICADNGIGFLKGKNQFVRQETGDFNHSIEGMVEDYQGNIWFASSRLGLLRLSRSTVTHVFADAGISPSVANTTALYKGLLYVGTDDGLLMIDTERRRSVRGDLKDALAGTRIRCIIPDSQGNLWICSYGKGLVRYGSDYTITQFSEVIPELGDRVRVCCELSDGTIAVSATGGLYFIKDNELIGSIPNGEALGYSQVLCMLETPDGTLYAGTDGDGIAVIHRDSIEMRMTRETGLPSGVILRMVTDPMDGSIWIVTSNSLCRMADGTVSILKSFPYSNNYDVILDKDGEVFVPGSAGVYIMRREALLQEEKPEYLLLNSRMGLIGSLTANAWNAMDANGDLYLCADRGVYKFNLDNYLLKHKSFRLRVSEIRVDDKSRHADRNGELLLARDTAKIEFFPEIINYTLDDPMVSYYLEGFDTDCKHSLQSDLPSIAYTNLKPGNYIFHLAIRDDNGSIVEESTYRVTKEMAIYDHLWFRFYMIGVAAVFIGWLAWFITRTQMQRTLELQQTKLQMALQQVQMGNETILAIAKTVDAKDVRTSKHSQRVSEYSKMIALEYGFTEEEAENLRHAALLHDIGKIAIPDSVLNKPARLTDEEYAIMKTHVTRGAEILKDFTLIDHVVEGARYHHERYDGRGYPDGLKGEEIPLYGRIISIADAFDAMTANRVYRKKQDFGYVMGELHKGRGTQFDPELLDIFLKLIDDKKIDIDALYEGAETPPEEQTKPESGTEEAKKA